MKPTLHPDSFREIRHESSQLLFVAFSGLQLEKVIPSFHWLNVFGQFPVNKLSVRDVRQMMYQQGIPGTGDTASSVGVFLQEYVASREYKSTLCMGGSLGAYAALLYGWFLGSDVVHAFSPLTLLPTRTPWQLIKLMVRGNRPLARVNFHLLFDRGMDRSCFDLKKVLSDNNGRTTFHIYYGTGHPRDAIHAKRMAEVPGVVLHPYDTAEHHVSLVMRDSGELAEIIGETRQQLEALAERR